VITRLILGGAQENTLYTAIGQHRDSRFDVTLICGVDEAGEGDLFTEAKAAGLKVVVLPSLVRPIRPASDIRALIDLTRLLRGRFDIVHTHSSKAGILGRIAARRAGVPIVVHTLHSLVFHEYQSAWKNAAYIRLKRLCAPMTDKIISVSEKTSQGAIAAHIGRRDQYVTIFSGMDLDLFLSVRDRLSVAEAKTRLGISPATPVVGKIARFFPLKGHEQFLDVAERVARRDSRVQFLLVGDGPSRREIEAAVGRRGLADRFVFAGRVPPEVVPACIQAMDVVVHTSLREGIARVLPQAGAVGKPVVTFDLDGASEVVHDGVSGYLVPAIDVDMLAARTVELLNDADRCVAFGEAGRRFVAANFSVDVMVERINAVYIDLIHGRQRAEAGGRFHFEGSRPQ
jgi:glycosyltransferase involved in cell wall biosynthesis